MFTYTDTKEINSLPTNPGVYAFKDAKNILYIGKAINIRHRVKTHFQQPSYRDYLFIDKVLKIGYIITNSEIDALLLEAELIKKQSPKYNVMWKDDKNFSFVAITKEKTPLVLIVHRKDIKATYIGPFVDSKAIKQTLRTLRRIFPYYTKKTHSKGKCQYCQLGLCPGPNVDIVQYKKNLKKLEMVLKGKKRFVQKELAKEMKTFSKDQKYELADHRKKQIENLEIVFLHSHIFNTKPLSNLPIIWPKIQKELYKLIQKKVVRIETYDISNTQGNQSTGSMVVFEHGIPAKKEYRKFKIHITGKPNDTAMMKETLERRFRHTEWTYPDMILIDGGKPQLTSAKKARAQFPKAKDIPLLAIAKRFNELYIEDDKTPVLLKTLPSDVSNLILYMRDEAHRFAITYHRKLRSVDLLTKKGNIT